MTYTAPEILGFIAALGVLLTALGGVIVNVIVALRTGNKIDNNLQETHHLRAEIKEVHTLTNSGLSAVKAELATSNALNIELRTIISDMKNEREKLSMASALLTMPPVPAVSATTGLSDAAADARSEAADARDVRADAREARADAADARADHSADLEDSRSTTAKADAASTKASLSAIKESTAAIDRNTR